MEDYEGWFGRLRKIVENQKPMEELIFDEKFEVLNVRGKNKENKIYVPYYRTGETGDYVDYNDKSINYESGEEHKLGQYVDGGFTKYLELKVKPLDETCFIKTILFEGDSPVLGGYTILAKIRKYEEGYIRSSFIYNKNNILYVERPYNEQESALEISILDDKGEIIRTDESKQNKI